MANASVGKDVWNFKPLFKNDDDPAMARQDKIAEQAITKFAAKWKNRRDYLENEKVLRKALDDYETIIRKYRHPVSWYYLALRNQQDQSNQKVKAKLAQATDFMSKLTNQLSFFDLNLGKISKTNQRRFVKSQILEPYRHYLERIFAEADYQLSEAEEKILNLKTNPAYELWVQMVSEFLGRETRRLRDESGKVINATEEEIMTLISSSKKSVRDQAAKALNDICAVNRDIATAEINAIFTNKKIDDELRGAKRPDLSRHLSDDIPTKAVDTLVQTVVANNNIAKDYYKLKAQLLGQKQLAYHERNVEYGNLNLNYSFKQATDMVGKVFIRIDPEFGNIFQRLLRNGQVDVYPRKGKRGGAFCEYITPELPTYVLLNFTGKLKDLTTYAHEMGHAVHGELMRVQNALNYDTSMATAEVASQFMEDFVLDEIRQTADNETKLSILMNELNNTVSAVHRQVACYRFEYDLHAALRQKGMLSSVEIGSIFQKNMSAYMGSAVEQSAGSENWWVYWSHIRTFFYTYSYAGGLLIANAMQSRVRQNPSSVGSIKQFLSAGMNASTQDLFKKMNIDITKSDFWQSGLDEIAIKLNQAKKLAKQLGKI